MRVKLTVEEYVREQYHRQMRRPSQCPNCGRFHRLWVHAYYDRDTTDSLGNTSEQCTNDQAARDASCRSFHDAFLLILLGIPFPSQESHKVPDCKVDHSDGNDVTRVADNRSFLCVKTFDEAEA